jgi:hypothetical protein
MDPSILAALLGTGVNLLGSPSQTIGDPNNVTNINQAGTDQLTALLQQLQAQQAQQTDIYGQQAAGQFGNLANYGQQGLAQGSSLINQGITNTNQGLSGLSTIQGQLANMPGFNQSTGVDQFQQNAPIYQDLANQASQQALGAFEAPAATQALFQADQNVANVANQFANMGASTSGAAAAAAAQGAQAPLNQLALDRANVANQAYLGTLNPLLQQGQQLASQNAQFGYNADQQALLSLLGAAQQQAQMGLNQAQTGVQAQGQAGNLAQGGAGGLANLSSLYAGLQGNALSGLTALGQPEYFQPTYTAGSGLLGMFS